jgi:hypothetical protein
LNIQSTACSTPACTCASGRPPPRRRQTGSSHMGEKPPQHAPSASVSTTLASAREDLCVGIWWCDAKPVLRDRGVWACVGGISVFYDAQGGKTAKLRLATKASKWLCAGQTTGKTRRPSIGTGNYPALWRRKPLHRAGTAASGCDDEAVTHIVGGCHRSPGDVGIKAKVNDVIHRPARLPVHL